ncbi:hypothetical protein E0Z10_g4033 [Xylaria hypoxylon]|uniref:Methyltransferase n=1 Tax=Xylaria hypoxylon TaxID=37992 RepID=A0A4Z0Z870_9PEZI|nr:hypothetical protein E0Z10_g4033 [Xylaria hypoxylon]
MSADGHGLPDNAIRGAHDMIHHAEQEEHEHEAASKRGLTDKAVEAEHDFMQHAEDDLNRAETMTDWIFDESGDAPPAAGNCAALIKVVNSQHREELSNLRYSLILVLELKGEKKLGKRNVSTIINYYRDPGDGSPPMPVRISDKTVTNERPTIAKQTIVKDITGEEDKYTLDRNGFHFRRQATQLRDADFHDEELVKAKYYPEAEQLLREMYYPVPLSRLIETTGAPRIHIFDHKVRVGPSNWHKLGEGNRVTRGPLFRAHVDQSYAGAELVLRRHFPDEADDLLKRRYQIINIWRPIHTIHKDPLAVADARSVPESDLLAASILYPRGSRDETWTMLPNDVHQWYFKDTQGPDEALLIKCFDSATRPGLARRAPHSAFEDPDMVDRGHRESIEARALVFYIE